jgi:uncharacterized membrane protein YjgN (DUF898 family)
MPSIGQTWVLASIGAVVEMGVLISTLKRLVMESRQSQARTEISHFSIDARITTCRKSGLLNTVVHTLKK